MKSLLLLLLAITSSLAMETNQGPVTLSGTSWLVTTFAGQKPLASQPITFEFDAEGNIAGDASCNRFGGTCTLEGNTMKLGPLRTTRRACEPEIMQQEQKFLELLGSVTTWEIGSEGSLILRGEAGEIRAEKAAGTPQE